MTFPAQLSTSYNLLCHIHKQNGKDQIFGKILEVFSLRTSIQGDFLTGSAQKFQVFPTKKGKV